MITFLLTLVLVMLGIIMMQERVNNGARGALSIVMLGWICLMIHMNG